LSTSAGSLLASRLFEGTGMGLIAVVSPAVIAAWFPSEKRGLAMGIWATWVSLGSLIIYNLAPSLNAFAGWQAVWWAGTAFALVAFSLYGLLIRMPSTAGAAPAEADAAQPDKTAPNLRQALSARSIWFLALSFGCFNFVVIGAIATFFPTFLTAERGYSLGSASWITSLKMLFVVAAAPVVGWISDRVGSPKRILLVSFFVLAVWMFLPFTSTGWLITASMVVLGILAGAIASATFSSVPEAVGKGQPAGIGMAVVMMGQNLGQLMGPMVFGRLVESAGWSAAGYWMIAVLVVGLIAVWFTQLR
jgi:MFS family permease